MLTCGWCGQTSETRFNVIVIVHDITKEERFALKCEHCDQPPLATDSNGALTFITIGNIPPSAKEAIDKWNELA